MQDEKVKELLMKYSEGHCTEAEKALIENWFLQFNEDDVDISPQKIEELGEEIFNKLPGNNNKIKWINLLPGIAALAACVLFIFGFYIYSEKKKTIVLAQSHDMAPGGNHAILTLADGKTVKLSNTKTGIIISSNKVAYNDGSSISGEGDNKGTQTITTPKGGQYQVILPDGSKVWLNAASSLEYPSTFGNAPTRTIKLSGEAYFEVAKDRAHPFVVSTKIQELEVLGTHFNIDAYADEARTTSTLLEGSVRINHNTLLRPGQQAVNKGKTIDVRQVDTDIAIAWKNGEFMFSREPLESIMRKVARWYDAEIVFEDQEEQQKLFGGTISRFNNVSEVLKMLELTGQVHFKIEGRRIVVME